MLVRAVSELDDDQWVLPLEVTLVMAPTATDKDRRLLLSVRRLRKVSVNWLAPNLLSQPFHWRRISPVPPAFAPKP